MKLLIDTEWATFIEDLSTDKQLEFFWAVFDYGNHKCSLKCWKKIQPLLEKGKIKYFNKLNNLKQYKTERDTESVPEREPKSEYKYKTPIGNSCLDNSPSLRTTRARDFTPPTLQEVFDYAKQQNDMAGCGGFECTKEMAEEFWGNYAGNGWVVSNESKTPIRDWKAKLRQWAVRNRTKTPADDIPIKPKEVPVC